jgi:hypothetical protein
VPLVRRLVSRTLDACMAGARSHRHRVPCHVWTPCIDRSDRACAEARTGSVSANQLRGLLGESAGTRPLDHARTARRPARSLDWPLEAHLDPENRRAFAALGRKTAARLRREYAAGTRSPWQGDPEAAARKGRAALKERLRDPVYRAEYGRKISERQRGPAKLRACVICGQSFDARPVRATCGRTCVRELKQRLSSAQRRSCPGKGGLSTWVAPNRILARLPPPVP